jgi:hypothetical protein
LLIVAADYVGDRLDAPDEIKFLVTAHFHPSFTKPLNFSCVA